MKLVTTYAALQLLGPAYRWKTEVYLEGTRREETLEGNLVLRGHGDPKLTYEAVWLLLRAVRARGLRDIRGDIVLDRSFFAPSPDDRIDDETFRPYNVAPDALLVNFKSLRFTFIPRPESGGVLIAVEPELPGLRIVNELHLSEGGCPEGRAFRELLQASFEAGPSPRALFTGRYPASCAEHDMNVALYAPQDYIAGMVRQLWSEIGGRWEGTLRDGLAPQDAAPFLVHESPPLAEIVRDINKFSNNVMARQLYLTLAAELRGAPAQGEQAYLAIREWLAQKHVAAPELVMENGSGLSRNERISAASLAALLVDAWHSPVMPEFVASLPIVAIDGTMRRRLRGEPIAGRGHVKTGLLNDARSIAGYVEARDGGRYVVVMIVNHPKAPQADAALDALLRWTYERAAPPKAPARATSRRPAALPRHP
jgi:D-alanyl-D-alanine carboxypeptidase/D-alanyl-D-alanine-endopeptidase (penicillin-binding protein 4)